MKFLVPILVALGIMTSVSSVTLPQASGSMMGKWSFYGTLSPKTDYRAKDFDRADIDTLQEILQYTDCIPGYEVTLTPAGVAEYLGNEHYKLESWEKLSDTLMLSVLSKGASTLQSAMGIPASITDILTGIILLSMLGCEFFINYKMHFRKSSDKEAA